MSWRTIDFQSIIDLDRNLVNQIDRYLQEKETRLAHQILNSLPAASNEPSKPQLPSTSHSHLKLADAVEGFTKRIRLLNREQLPKNQSDKGVRLITDLNATFWEFTEVLEGCVVELFQQIKQVNVDQWHRSLAEVVQSIKDVLIHYLDDLIWTIRRLEGPLREYRQKLGFSPEGWIKLFKKQSPQLDPTLLINLTQTEHYLKAQYENFLARYVQYIRLNTKVEDFLEKMKSYPVLALLDIQDQNTYVDVFRLLKLREQNPQPRGELALETIRSLKNLCSIHGVVRVFKIYYHGLKDAFFNSSLELKDLAYESTDLKQVSKHVLNKVKEYYNELQQLIMTMSWYREFILQTDPNPYVRSRWGFKEGSLAPEPPKAKSLLNRIYLTEELKRCYEQFMDTLSKDPITHDRQEARAHQEIDKLLHEMGQPLISQSMMRNRADQLLTYIKECDEIGSSHYETIAYLQEVFSRAMRADWKYHVLHEFPLFHELYRMHRGLEQYMEDPAHAFRMERFYALFDQIEDWVQKGDVYSHVHEIELDVNDMKTYLQDFLAAIQRASREKFSDPFLDDTIHKFRQQLLEYRYAFGQFFLNIISKSLEGQQLRNQFLFVDQYFESVETLLNELKAAWERGGIEK